MSRYSKYQKLARCGSMDSKYFGKLDQFEKDIAEKQRQSNNFSAQLKDLITRDTDEFPSMEARYQDAIEVFWELKEKYGLGC